jgi:transposase
MLIAPLTPRGVEAAMTLSGALNSFASEFFVEKILCPVLARNNVVVLDNLSAHKAASARALIAATSAEVVFLPPYSLDSNPIELAFSKIKQVMRSSAARTQEALDGRLPRQSRR